MALAQSINSDRKIAKLVNEFIAKRKLFTAYDVTTELRNRFPEFNVEHQEVRNYLNDFTYYGFLSKVFYVRNLWPNWIGSGEAPFIYHNQNDPISLYFSNDLLEFAWRI